MDTLQLKTCTFNTVDNLRGFAYVRQRGGPEIIALRSDLEAAANGERDVVIVEGVAQDADTGLPGWTNATAVRDGATVWAQTDYARALVTVARQDIRDALIMSMCREVVSLAEGAMDWAGDYAAFKGGLETASSILRGLPVIAPGQTVR